MRHRDHVLFPDQLLVGKVRDVARDLAALDRGEHVLVADDLAAGLVDDAHAVLHPGKDGGVDHVVRLLGVGDVEADVIALFQQLVERLGPQHVAREVPGRVHAHEGVVAVDGHFQRHGEVRHQRARRAQADHAHGLAHQLRPAEGVLALFDELGDLLALARDGLDPFDAAEHLARGEHQRAHLQLLDRLGVRAGAVEDDDALFGAVLDGDVVIARSGARDAQKLLVEGVVVQLGAADQHGLRLLYIGADPAAAFCQHLDAHGRDAVHGLYLKHDLFQTPSYSRPASARPRAAWRCRARRACPP